jgi:hypothetical protein
MGHILLEGGSEFGGQMEECDRRAIQLAGGVGARIRIVPTAAVPDDNHQRAGENGVRWFRSLGVVTLYLNGHRVERFDRGQSFRMEPCAILPGAES